jgi:glycerol transport system ATP-binding protein
VNLPVPAALAGIADGAYTIGFQPHHLSPRGPECLGASRSGQGLVTEITGSESFVHLAFADARWVMLAHGILSFEPDEMVEVFIDPRHIMVFDDRGRGRRRRSWRRRGQGWPHRSRPYPPRLRANPKSPRTTR